MATRKTHVHIIKEGEGFGFDVIDGEMVLKIQSPLFNHPEVYTTFDGNYYVEDIAEKLNSENTITVVSPQYDGFFDDISNDELLIKYYQYPIPEKNKPLYSFYYDDTNKYEFKSSNGKSIQK